MPQPPADGFLEPAAEDVPAAEPASDVMKHQLVADVDAAMIQPRAVNAEQQGVTGLQILVTLGQSGEAISAKELSEQLSQPLSSTYRHLKTLLRWGLAEENGQGRYLPGPACLQLAKKFDREAVLVTLAKSELKRLAEQSQESVALMVPSNGQAICIELVDSSQPLRCC